MKRIAALIIAAAIAAGFIVFLSHNNTRKVIENADKMTYYNTDSRNHCLQAMEAVLRDNSLPVFGSSELDAVDEVAYPKWLFNDGNSDFNMIMVGRGYTQCLHHAINAAALAEHLPNKKLMLILSPQWFTADGVNKEAFAGRFSERMFSNVVRNPALSYETKRRIADRVEYLLEESDPEEYKRIMMYDRVFIERQIAPADSLYLCFWDLLMNNKARADLLTNLSDVESTASAETTRFETLDFGQLLARAVQVGEETCTNNDFYIQDAYFDTYIRNNLSSGYMADKGNSYLDSPEYEDLELFLDVCNELGIHALVVSVPVKGVWYDWRGWPTLDRQGYYQRIRDICRDKGCQILDYSDKEYEPYFIQDAMHLGWKAWVYLDEAAYRYYLSPDVRREYPFDIKAALIRDGERNYIKVATRISDVDKAWLTLGDEKLDLSMDEEGYLVSSDLPAQFTVNGDVSLETNGTVGTGIKGRVTLQTEEYYMAEHQLSHGTRENENGSYTFMTSEPNNSFSFTVFLLCDSETNEYILDFGKSDGRDHVEGEYLHELESGFYKLMFKANSNLKDESVWSIEYLEQGETYHYSYLVPSLTGKKVDTENVRFWHVIEQQPAA